MKPVYEMRMVHRRSLGAETAKDIQEIRKLHNSGLVQKLDMTLDLCQKLADANDNLRDLLMDFIDGEE